MEYEVTRYCLDKNVAKFSRYIFPTIIIYWGAKYDTCTVATFSLWKWYINLNRVVE